MRAVKRSGTRISCEIPIRLDLVDSIHASSEPGQIILVNPRGCAARFQHALEIGTRVRLKGLAAKRTVTARVVNCFWPGESSKFWVLGLALEEPGNIWGIERPPDDWRTNDTPLS